MLMVSLYTVCNRSTSKLMTPLNLAWFEVWPACHSAMPSLSSACMTFELCNPLFGPVYCVSPVLILHIYDWCSAYIGCRCEWFGCIKGYSCFSIVQKLLIFSHIHPHFCPLMVSMHHLHCPMAIIQGYSEAIFPCWLIKLYFSEALKLLSCGT